MMKQAIGDYAIHYHGDKSAYEGLKLTANGTLSAGEKGNGAIRIEHMDKLHELLLSRIRGDKQISDALRAISPDGCVLPVSYESYLRHPHLTLERVQKFLGMRTDEMHPALRAKANRDSICDLVENWAELCEAFFNCMPWRWMLDDYENGCSCSALSPSRFHASKKFCSI